MVKKCIVVLNGPSVSKINNFIREEAKSGSDMKFDIIACNRWLNVFENLGLNAPNYVVIGKNSLSYNRPLMRRLPETVFFGIDRFQHSPPNYRLLKFGPAKVYGQKVDMKGALWWTGIYAIQLALKKEYDEIHVFGFTCNDQPDYADTYRRTPIRQGNVNKIIHFLTELKNKGIMERIHFHEDMDRHPFRDIIGKPS